RRELLDRLPGLGEDEIYKTPSVEILPPDFRSSTRKRPAAPRRPLPVLRGTSVRRVGDSAAFFDLDRTLLRGASGPVISEALKQVGLMRDRRIPGEALVYRLFNIVGESRPTMQLARQAARFAQGWSRLQAQEAGRIAAETLVGAVQPFASPLID